eukprot:6455794-Alexandrium_andersonii.AAC.1
MPGRVSSFATWRGALGHFMHTIEWSVADRVRMPWVFLLILFELATGATVHVAKSVQKGALDPRDSTKALTA